MSFAVGYSVRNAPPAGHVVCGRDIGVSVTELCERAVTFGPHALRWTLCQQRGAQLQSHWQCTQHQHPIELGLNACLQSFACVILLLVHA